jgi:hypothetical protein
VIFQPPGKTIGLRMNTKLFLAILSCLLPVSLVAQTADEIVNKALEARGGIAKIRAVKAERITGRISFQQGLEGTLVLELERPHKLYSEVAIAGLKILRVYDGKSDGWTLNPFSGQEGVVEMSAEELKEMPEESDGDGPMVDYKARESKVELAGKEDLEGKSVYRLQITPKNGEARSYFIDPATFLTVKWTGLRKINGELLPWECALSDYREVQGLKFPFKIDQGSPGTEFRQTLTVEKVEIDPPIDESHFAKPVAPPAPATPAQP